MKKLFLFCSLFIVIHVQAQMQSGSNNQSLIDVSTKSPDVASLGKFGNIPVSYSTGVPSISIPFYDISVAKIKIPLSLDYHAGGIRVSEISSSAGLGWALSGIGIISRQVVGIPDEDGSFGLFLSPNPDSVVSYPWYYPSYLFGVQLGHGDNEPDAFSYSINGQSGRFSFRRDGSIMQEPITNNKIVFTGDTFTITDENGVLYIFSLKMNSAMSLSSDSRYYTAAWRLSKMVDANSIDTVYFSYETACNPIIQKNYNYSAFLGDNMICNGGENFQNTYTTTSQTGTLYEAYPKEIRWRGGKVTFTNTCDRADVAGSAMRLTEASVYANQEGTLKQVKRMVLYQSYFYSNGSGAAFTNATEDQKKRLRLDSVGFLPVTGTLAKQTYRMTYDTTILMAPRESCAEDRWGFNNGAFTNISLMPPQTVTYRNNYYTVGNADRTVKDSYMKACMINSIQYPTKGTSVFIFEPHDFYVQEKQISTQSIQVNIMGGERSVDSVIFTPLESDMYFKCSFSLPAIYGHPEANTMPRIEIIDLTTNQSVFGQSLPIDKIATGYTGTDLAVQVISGHTYRFVLNFYANIPGVSGYGTLTWTRDNGIATVRKTGGGLRVNTITNYDDNGRIVGKEKYEYSGGTMLTDLYYQNINVEQVRPRGGGNANSTICNYALSLLPPGYAFLFHANSTVPTSQCNGSPLLYSNVTKYQIDSAGNDNGKTVYGYNIAPDLRSAPEFLETAGPLTFNTRGGPYLTSYIWKNNYLSYVDNYRITSSGYRKVSCNVYDYAPYRESSEPRLKIHLKYMTTCCLAQNMDSAMAGNDFDLIRLDQPTGVMLLGRESDTTWDDYGNIIYRATQYEYNDNSHTYPTLQRTYNSTGEIITQSTKYPHDLAAAGNVYQKMMDRNIVSPVIQQIKQKNGVQLTKSTINYTDYNNNSKLLVPLSIDEQISNYPTETTIRFKKFDSYGNIQEQQKDSDVSQSYVWGYDTISPIAVISNAAQNQVAYTSFEPDAAGTWTIASATRDITQGITGSQSYSLTNGTVSKAGLTSGKSYIVSYWSKAGSASVNGAAGILMTTKNGWNYYEHKISSGSTVTVSGSVTIDELRVYPTDAQMVSFTYDPLIGMTSQCDAAGRVTYFEYDSFNRLKLLRDMDRNIIKTYEYRYKQ